MRHRCQAQRATGQGDPGAPLNDAYHAGDSGRLPPAGYKRRLESVTYGKVPTQLVTVFRARKTAVLGGPLTRVRLNPHWYAHHLQAGCLQ